MGFSEIVSVTYFSYLSNVSLPDRRLACWQTDRGLRGLCLTMNYLTKPLICYEGCGPWSRGCHPQQQVTVGDCTTVYVLIFTVYKFSLYSRMNPGPRKLILAKFVLALFRYLYPTIIRPTAISWTPKAIKNIVTLILTRAATRNVH